MKYDRFTNDFVLNEGDDSILPQLVWVITDNCPNNCPFCFQPKTGTDFEIASLFETIELFIKLGVQKIDISGGEPLQYRFLKDVCNALASNNIQFTLTTNGIGTESNKEWLITKCDMFSRIMLSINGFDEMSHDRLCSGTGIFSQTMKTVLSLHAVGYNRLRINTVLTKALLPPQNLESYLGTLKHIKPNELCLIQAHPENKKPTFDAHNISSTEFRNLATEIEMRLKTSGTKILIRTVDNYRGYWVLYPNVIIRRHADNPDEVVEYDFKSNNISILIHNISGNVWVPNKEKE